MGEERSRHVPRLLAVEMVRPEMALLPKKRKIEIYVNHWIWWSFPMVFPWSWWVHVTPLSHYPHRPAGPWWLQKRDGKNVKTSPKMLRLLRPSKSSQDFDDIKDDFERYQGRFRDQIVKVQHYIDLSLQHLRDGHPSHRLMRSLMDWPSPFWTGRSYRKTNVSIDLGTSDWGGTPRNIMGISIKMTEISGALALRPDPSSFASVLFGVFWSLLLRSNPSVVSLPDDRNVDPQPIPKFKNSAVRDCNRPGAHGFF